MITIRDADGVKDSPDRSNIIALAAAIQTGDRDEAFHQLDTLFAHDSDCAELVAQGRNRRHRTTKLEGMNA